MLGVKGRTIVCLNRTSSMLGKNTPGLCLDGIILMLNNGGWNGNSGVWG